MSLIDKVKKINKTKAAKMVLLGVVGIGVTKIVKDTIANQVVPDNKVQEFTVKVATYGIAAVATVAVKKHLDDTILTPMIKGIKAGVASIEEDLEEAAEDAAGVEDVEITEQPATKK